MPKQPHFDKRSAGTAGKKPPAPSLNVRRPTAFDTLVEMLNRKSRADAAEPRSAPKKKRRQVG
jgi:hypothetical protein